MMQDLLPNYSSWRHKYARASVIVYFVIVIMEFAIFFVLKTNNMILESLPRYIELYFVRPILGNTLIGLVSFLLVMCVKNERVKNAVSVLALTCIFGLVAYVHNVFFVTMLLFCIPILMTIVFGDKKLLWTVVGTSVFFVLCVAIRCIVEKTTAGRDPYFLPSVIIALVGIIVCGGIAGTLIRLLDGQNQKLLRAVEEANKANRYKSAFLSNMSHEIRTPMNAIVGITDVMLRTERNPADEKYLLNIKHSGDILLGIINDILDFSKMESGKLELIEGTYSFFDMLDDLTMIFWNRIGNKNIELIYDIDCNVPEYLVGDEIRVRQVLINLVNNAIKFTENGFVKLKVNAEYTENDRILLHMAVSDSGQGIKKEDLPKLFHSYEQVNTRKNHQLEGTGLGLAIAKQLVEMMGGAIRADSEYGSGTTFSFQIYQKKDQKTVIPDYGRLTETLALERIAVQTENGLLRQSLIKTLDAIGIRMNAGEQNPSVCFVDRESYTEKEGKNQVIMVNPYRDDLNSIRGKIISKPVYPHSLWQALLDLDKKSKGKTKGNTVTFEGARILLVEDNALNREVAKLLLEPLKMEIDMAVNGQDACEKIQKKQYDLVFMDQMMPVMDGVEATRLIRSLEDEYYQKLPIIALTANAMTEAKEELIAAGMNDVAVKPIVMEHIVEVLTKWIG